MLIRPRPAQSLLCACIRLVGEGTEAAGTRVEGAWASSTAAGPPVLPAGTMTGCEAANSDPGAPELLGHASSLQPKERQSHLHFANDDTEKKRAQ